MAKTRGVLGHRGLTGTVNKDDEDGVYYGSLRLPRDLVCYEGDTFEELVKHFKEAVDDYIADCVADGSMDPEGIPSA